MTGKKSKDNYRKVIATRRRIYKDLKLLGIKFFDSKPLGSCSNKTLLQLYKSKFSVSEDALKELKKVLSVKDNETTESCVYVIGNKDLNYFKIGYSENPTKVLKKLKCSCPFPIEIIELYKTPQPKTLDTDLRNRLKGYLVEGGWYKVDKNKITI